MKAALLNNRYRIIKTLGRGGFGETYLTEDTHMPSGRKCVLKQLKPIVKQPKTPLWMKERFQREAAILEELGQGSEQIPRLYAYFSEDDKFYLVQEWIEGLTLEQYWEQEGNLHRDEVRQILVELLPVLDYVHSRRIIHRDIKPENIILRRGDNRPFLIDFGAVKEAIATEVNRDSVSTYSASIGTPGYMSSEQAAGRPIYSSDLYSLGLTAIFLLTGKSPNELETDSRSGEIIWQEHASNLDSEMIEILDKAVRFHPRDRFSTAQEMLDALNTGVNTSQANGLTGATLNIAPGRNSLNTNYASQKNNTNIYTKALPLERGANPKPKKRSLLLTLCLFILIATGVAAGTFATGYALVSNLWRSPESVEKQPQVQKQGRQPDIFTPEEKIETAPEEPNNKKEQDQIQQDKLYKTAGDIEQENSQPEISPTSDRDPKPNTDTDINTKSPKVLAKIDVEPRSEINFPLVTTGASESQLVSTLGQPTSQRQGWQPNSKVLVYYDVVPDQVNLSYQSDNTGKIRQTDIALNQTVSLGAMQQALSKMLGGNAPADVKEKLRTVYDRQAAFSFFKLNNLEGKVQRDSKDRVNISVWEKGFQFQ